MDKIDGPYYFFKLIRRIRQVVPAWMPMPGVEGREINIVPVDFVVKAMDHIAHLDGLDGRAFSLTDPDPLSAGEVIDVFARAAHAPQSTVRAPASATEALQPFLTMGLSNVPFANGLTDRVLADFGIPRSVLIYLNYPTHFDSRRTQAALGGHRDQGAAARGLRRQALGLLGPAPRPRPLPRPDAGRSGPRSRRAHRWARADPRGADPRRGDALRPPAAGQHVAGEGGQRQGRAGHRRLLGDRQVGRAEDRRRRRHRPARRPDPGEARGDPRSDRPTAAGSPTSTAATSPTSTTSTGWPPRCSNSTATSTS